MNKKDSLYNLGFCYNETIACFCIWICYFLTCGGHCCMSCFESPKEDEEVIELNNI